MVGFIGEFSHKLVRIQAVRRAPRHFAVYGNANRYRPVISSNASGISAERPSQFAYFPRATATPLAVTATVNAMDNHR